MSIDDFEIDLNILTKNLGVGCEAAVVNKLEALRDKLVNLWGKNGLKINHTAMEMVCAKPLILRGLDVDLEHHLGGGVECDLYATGGNEKLIVEIETGFVPPEHALDPITSCEARIAGKIVRYSKYATRFGLGAPPNYIMEIPRVLTKPVERRRRKEVEAVRTLCAPYYAKSAISLDEIKNAKIHTIYIINVDKASVKELSPISYIKKYIEHN